MFGYIKPRKSEMLVREHEVYKSVYCGLCHAINTNISGLSTLVLSYDVVFLVLFRLAAAKEPITIKKKRCVAHMIKPQAAAFSPDTMRYCACVSSVLSYYKLKDDIKDKRGFGRFKRVLALPFLSGFRKRANVDHELEKDIAAYLDELDGLEHSGNFVPDECAEVFGKLLGRICSYGFEGVYAHIADEFGIAVGRWIYLIDALDDYEEDIKNGEFNPYSKFETLPVEDLIHSLDLELSRAIRAFDLIDCGDKTVSGIIYNILKFGMPDVASGVINKQTGDNN
ncbi:MAG: hypothetical protein IJT91_02405 [Clostridia bacterium]|nr:hypothetical protein [Clostridia bacterium]